MSDLRRSAFIKELAIFLAGRQCEMSVRLEANPEDPLAQQWLVLRNRTPLFGYPSAEEAEKQLKEFLCL